MKYALRKYTDEQEVYLHSLSEHSNGQRVMLFETAEAAEEYRQNHELRPFRVVSYDPATS